MNRKRACWIEEERRARKQGKVDNVYYVWYLNGKTIRIQSHTPLTVATLQRHIENETGIPEHNQWLFRLTPLKQDGTHPREDDGESGELTDKATMLSDGDTVVMVVKPEEWQAYAPELVDVSEHRQLVTQKANCQWSLTTLGGQYTKGVHYLEFELVANTNLLHVGVYGVGTDLRAPAYALNPTRCIFTSDGRLAGGGIFRSANRTVLTFTQAERNCKGFRSGYTEGDRIGVLLNLDEGSLLFFKNGMKHGGGFPAGDVKGPVTVGVQMFCADEGYSSAVRIVPHPDWPEGYTP